MENEHSELPVARQRGEAACLYVDPLVAVGLVLVRGAGLHLGEALVRRDGVHLHPPLPAVLLPTGGLVRRGRTEWTANEDRSDGGAVGAMDGWRRREAEDNEWPTAKK